VTSREYLSATFVIKPRRAGQPLADATGLAQAIGAGSGQNGDMTLDLNAYFDRINFRGAAEPTLDALQGLVSAHTRTVPFENLDPLMGAPVDDLGPDALTDKLVHRRRGGYCYEQNGLMGYVLSEIGFRVRRLAGRVIWMLPPDAPFPAQTHTVLAVTFPGSQGAYLVDVGFGGQTPPSPIRIETGSVQQTTLEPYRLEDRRDGLMLQALIRGEWVPLYEFSTRTAPAIDLKVGSWFVSTHPSSHFVTGLMAARVIDDARLNLAGRNLTVHGAEGSEKIRLDDAPAVVDALTERFGINVADLGDRGALEARLDKVLDA
jgi:arylamine N-acetyltransferase